MTPAHGLAAPPRRPASPWRSGDRLWAQQSFEKEEKTEATERLKKQQEERARKEKAQRRGRTTDLPAQGENREAEPPASRQPGTPPAR